MRLLAAPAPALLNTMRTKNNNTYLFRFATVCLTSGPVDTSVWENLLSCRKSSGTVIL